MFLCECVWILLHCSRDHSSWEAEQFIFFKLFIQDVWKIKRCLRKEDARAGLQREELTILCKTFTLIVPSPALWLRQCIPLTMLSEESISFSLYILCFPFMFCFGVTVESQVSYGFRLKQIPFTVSSSVFCALLSVDTIGSALQVSPFLLLKTSYLFTWFCTKDTIQNQTVFCDGIAKHKVAWSC